MKINFVLGTLLRRSLVLLLLLLTGSVVSAQDVHSKDPGNFHIVIENTPNGVKMKSLEGAAWKELSFTLKDDQVRIVNELGMVDPYHTDTSQDSSLSHFRFSIMKTKKRVALKSLNGTDWKELTFTLPVFKTQSIDRSGMIE